VTRYDVFQLQPEASIDGPQVLVQLLEVHREKMGGIVSGHRAADLEGLQLVPRVVEGTRR
jgi:hypothetical protein